MGYSALYPIKIPNTRVGVSHGDLVVSEGGTSYALAFSGDKLVKRLPNVAEYAPNQEELATAREVCKATMDRYKAAGHKPLFSAAQAVLRAVDGIVIDYVVGAPKAKTAGEA